MVDRLTGMAVFVRVAETGSFTEAARVAGLSPTMVGKHIQLIERRLGAQLIARTTRRQALTEVGRLYLERCRQVLAEVAAADASAEELAAAPRGLLRVHATVSLGAELLAPVVARYLAAYPEVEIDLMLADRPVDLLEEGLDLTIGVGRPRDSSLVGREIGHYAMWLAASPDYLARRGTPLHPQDLAVHDCLSFAFWSRKDLWRLGRDGVMESVRVAGRLTINNGQGLRNAALHGAGIVMQPALLLASDVAAGRLVRLLPDWAPRARPIHLLYAPGRRPTPKLRSFIDCVVAALRDAPQACGPGACGAGPCG